MFVVGECEVTGCGVHSEPEERVGAVLIDDLRGAAGQRNVGRVGHNVRIVEPSVPLTLYLDYAPGIEARLT
jgi:hypothetical protein